MNIYQNLGLQRVINASGRMTALGVSVAAEKTAEAMKEATRNFVDISDLMDAAGKMIASYTGGEDACPTTGAAAGIAIAVAACIAKESLSIAQKLPDSTGLPNEVILQKGHSINFGASVAQMVALGGGKVIEVGSANHTHETNVIEAITDKTVALLYVKSHHCVQKGMVSFEAMVDFAKNAGVPLIVDAAAEEDLRKYLSAGADLVIYSGSKAIEGPVSGFITGRADLIAACKLQYHGIARPMKIGKEGIVGLLTALEVYTHKDIQAEKEKEKASLDVMKSQIETIDGLDCTIVQDSAGRDIYRLRVSANEKVAGLNVYQLIDKLASGEISVRTRNHLADLGIIEIDPRPLLEGDAQEIVNKFKRIIDQNE